MFGAHSSKLRCILSSKALSLPSHRYPRHTHKTLTIIGQACKDSRSPTSHTRTPVVVSLPLRMRMTSFRSFPRRGDPPAPRPMASIDVVPSLRPPKASCEPLRYFVRAQRPYLAFQPAESPRPVVPIVLSTMSCLRLCLLEHAMSVPSTYSCSSKISLNGLLGPSWQESPGIRI